jgi:hypothetical protein
MKTLPQTIPEAREYILPLFLVHGDEHAVKLEGRRFLGTAFFVTSKGDAITAAHVIPAPETVPTGMRLIAVAWVNGKQQVCWINAAASFESFDVALVKVNIQGNKFVPISTDEVPAGTDVSVLGVPSHEVTGGGKEMRILKGHVTFVNKRLELNFPIPAGMSGSPVLVQGRAVGYATGRVRSEEVEDQYEELVTVSESKEEVRIVTTSHVTYYGTAYPFFAVASIRDPTLEGMSITEFVAKQNGSR